MRDDRSRLQAHSTEGATRSLQSLSRQDLPAACTTHNATLKRGARAVDNEGRGPVVRVSTPHSEKTELRNHGVIDVTANEDHRPGAVRVYTLATLVALAVQKRVIMPQFEQLERSRAVPNMERCIKAIQSEQEHLAVLAQEWGHWGDTVTSRARTLRLRGKATSPQNFPRACSSTSRSTFFSMNMATSSGAAPLHGLPGGVFISHYAISKLKPDDPLLKFDSNDSSHVGMVQTKHRLMLLATRPDHPHGNAWAAQAKGTIVYTELVDEGLLLEIHKNTEVEVRLWAPGRWTSRPESLPATLASFGSSFPTATSPSTPTAPSGYTACLTMLGGRDRVCWLGPAYPATSQSEAKRE